MAKVLSTGVPDENNWTYISKNGKRFTVRLSVSSVISADGVVIGFIGVAKDITEELRTLKEVQITYDRLQRVVDSTGEGIWERKYDSHEMQFMNIQSKRIFGFSDDYNPNLEEIYSRIRPDEALKIKTHLEQHIADSSKGFDFEFSLEQVGDGNKLKWVRARGCIAQKDGKPDQLVATISDVTKIVNAREQSEFALEKANVAVAAKSAFLASMSHEIRTPLNGIIGMTDLILDTELTKEQRILAQAAQQSGQSLLSLICDILDFSKMEAGKIELECLELDLAMIVENQISIMAVKSSQKKISISSFISLDIPKDFLGDSGKLGQILLNLIGNAVKFTENGGVLVDVRFNSAGELRFEIKDQGIGISHEDIAKLFVPFSQADSSISNKFGGTGLGLSICKRLVEVMGGRIGVLSQLGMGSTFWFEIPFLSTSNLKQYSTESSQYKGMQFLLIEDDQTVISSLQNYFECMHIKSDVFSTLEVALKTLKKNGDGESGCYDLLLISTRIIEESAVENTENLQRMIKEFKLLISHIVSLSEFLMPINNKLIHDLNVVTDLKKPIKQSELLALFNKVMGAVEAEDILPPLENRYELRRSEGAGLHVLVAEDVPVNQLLIQKMLEKLGHIPTIVSNGIELLEKLDSNTHYDLILMDCQMPEMDGFEATSLIRAHKNDRIRNILIVALTANVMNGDEKKCIDLGMNDYMTKPLKIVQLDDMLKKWLRPPPSFQA